MSGRVGIDFGTSNSVVSVINPDSGIASAIALQGLSTTKPAGGHDMTVVPSLVHYDATIANVAWYGAEVLARNLYDHDHTFRWMKRYVADRTAIGRRIGSRLITPLDAGRDFLVALLASALVEVGAQLDEEVAFSAPVESFEHYDTWLRDVAETAGIRRFRLIDEASAAALGYGAHIQPGDVYLVFDFGGGTLDVSVVRIEGDHLGQTGRRCRVLGKAGAKVGGTTIDAWMFQEVLRRSGKRDLDDDVRPLSTELIVACERAKERLSAVDSVEISAIDAATGNALSETMTRSAFEDLLDLHEMFTSIEGAVDLAIDRAHERGFGRDHIKQVLLVGGSSLIPAVQKQLVRQFGRERVLLSRPLEAVALGAASFVSGVDFFDHIQHNYAVRHVDANSSEYTYRTIVKSGTSYPSEGPIHQFAIKAVYDGQEDLGVAIFELSEPSSSARETANELIFDSSGAARMVEISVDTKMQRSHFWMNENNPTFLKADPPAKKGENRFDVQFHIDQNKRLLITARDLRNQRWVFDRHPVVKLT
jgi:molecular chaperone DnaK